MSRQWISVQSSNVQALCYDAACQELDVRFHNGTAYRYFSVSASMWDALRIAPSVGRELNLVIRPVCPFQRLSIEEQV